MALNYTISTSGLGNKVYFSKLGDPMAFNDCEVKCDDRSPLDREVDDLKREINNRLESINNQQEYLRIARAKLAAVKKLVK